MQILFIYENPYFFHFILNRSSKSMSIIRVLDDQNYYGNFTKTRPKFHKMRMKYLFPMKSRISGCVFTGIEKKWKVKDARDVVAS